MIKQLKQLFRTHTGRLFFITVPVTIAVALFVLMRMIIGNVDRQIAEETKPLLGADIVIDGTSVPLSQEQLAPLDAYEISKKVQFSTNLFSESDGVKLVRVEGVQENFPFYGTYDITSISGVKEGVLLDRGSFELFGGSGSIELGDVVFPIAGIIESSPGATIDMFDGGRTILVPYDKVESTGLTAFGSRVRYDTLIKVSSEEEIPGIVEKLQNNPLYTGLDIDDYLSRAGQVNGILGDFDRYVTTVLIMSFLLVVVIVMTSVRTFLSLEKRSIGLFKVLGQSTKSLVVVYLLLFAVCFLIAWILGSLLGSAGILRLQTLPETAGFVLLGGVWQQAGLVVLIIASLGLVLPYSEIFWNDALSLLRTEQKLLSSWKKKLLQPFVIIGGIRLFYGVILGERQGGIMFSGGLLILGVLIGLLVMGLLRGATRGSKDMFSFMRFDGFRSSIAPGNQSRTLGVGLTVITTVIIVLSILSQSFLTTLRGFTEDQPSLFVLNIRQEDQPIIEQQYPGAQLFDTILARIVSINGIPLSEFIKNKETRGGGGEFTREFNTTTAILEDSPVLEGTAVSGGTTTVDIEFAKRLGVGIGDSIEFSVQGRKITLTVSGLRKAERSGATPFFYFRFDPVEFKEAPRTFFRSVIVDKENKDALQRGLIDSLGKHLSFVDVDQIIETVADIASKIIAVINALLLTVMLLILCSAYVAVESLGYLRKKKVQLYTKLGATQKMTERSLWSELMLIVGVSLLLGIIVSGGSLGRLFTKVTLIQFEWVMIGKVVGIVFGIVMCYAALGGVMVKRSR